MKATVDFDGGFFICRSAAAASSFRADHVIDVRGSGSASCSYRNIPGAGLNARIASIIRIM
ncbi:MAG: hypothetical protein H7335_01965 [Massilia sp.]|nr:hypothetical protein [Massilia sp.]